MLSPVLALVYGTCLHLLGLPSQTPWAAMKQQKSVSSQSWRREAQAYGACRVGVWRGLPRSEAGCLPAVCSSDLLLMQVGGGGAENGQISGVSSYRNTHPTISGPPPYDPTKSQLPPYGLHFKYSPTGGLGLQHILGSTIQRTAEQYPIKRKA